jgi:glycerol uptake facilitator-like aquaporin
MPRRYIVAQVLGAFIGVGAAHLMFGEAFIQVSQHARSGGGQLFSEFVATFGLLCVIWGCPSALRSGSDSGVSLHHRRILVHGFYVLC